MTRRDFISALWHAAVVAIVGGPAVFRRLREWVAEHLPAAQSAERGAVRPLDFLGLNDALKRIYSGPMVGQLAAEMDFLSFFAPA